MLGGSHYSHINNFTDSALVESAQTYLENHFKVDPSNPDCITVKHLPRCIPQYKVGHLTWINQLWEALDNEYPMLWISGNYLDGSGLPYIINYAKLQVKKLRDLSTW